MLAKIPRQIEHWRLRDWFTMGSSTTGDVKPPSHTDQLFWLDTFCIPQGSTQADLRRKAIGSMNLVYAAASQTLILDAGLQNFDAGQRPSSLATGGRATFFGPTEEKLLDTLARICASSWMGRAW
jgi:hypothetical protein